MRLPDREREETGAGAPPGADATPTSTAVDDARRRALAWRREFLRLVGPACTDERGRLDPDKLRVWQAAHGLAPTGTVRGDTVEAARRGAAADGHAGAIRRQPAGGPKRAARLDEGEAAACTPDDVEPATPGIHLAGFIDHGDGANLRTGPAELGGQLVRAEPLPPATRVFASGRHRRAPAWWYVTAQLSGELSRGYVQDFRVATDLPEPTARLHAIESGDTVERLAVREFGAAVRDGHDLRYYENVLLWVNQARGRGGIRGSFQEPGLLGGGANNVQLVAGHRIWLVSPAYARSLEGVVPTGSRTGGLGARAGRFAAHLDDINRSVQRAPGWFPIVAGEYAEAILDHLPVILGVTALVIGAEAASIALAAAPTGASQIAALAIQAGLSAFGVTMAVSAAADALTHGIDWLTLAWTAGGDAARIDEASRALARMVVAIALAALAVSGAAGSLGKTARLANNIKIELPPTGLVPALAVEGGETLSGLAAMTQANATTGGPVALSSQMSALGGAAGGVSRLRPRERESLGEGPEVDAIKETGRTRAGAARRPRHHVLPQEWRAWFEERGFIGELDIDNFCVELSEAEHQALHGGGDWRVGRSWPGEWNNRVMAELRRLEDLTGSPLTPKRILRFIQMLMKEYKIPANFVPYRG